VDHYRGRFQSLIQDWRKAWGSDFPFYFVQLPNISGAQTNAAESSPWAQLREAQRLTLSVPNTAMAVTIDIGGGILHPIDKWDVGKRLSLPARAQLYGEPGLVFSGPIYQSMQAQGKTILLSFRNAAALNAKGGAKPAGFAIAGTDNKWVWADAAINNDVVTVSSTSVSTPTQVRYGWGQNPPCNVYNGAGLPMSPFQTTGEQLPVSIIEPFSRKSQYAISPSKSGNVLIDGLGRNTAVRLGANRKNVRILWKR